MSHVKTKNAVLKMLYAAVAAEALPKCTFETALDQGRIEVAITSAPFPCLKDECLTLNKDGTHSFVINLFGSGDKSSYTPECEALVESVKALVRSTVDGTGARFWVHASSKWINAQAFAKRVANARAVTAPAPAPQLSA